MENLNYKDYAAAKGEFIRRSPSPVELKEFGIVVLSKNTKTYAGNKKLDPQVKDSVRDYSSVMKKHKELSKAAYDKMKKGEDSEWINGSYHSSVYHKMEELKRNLTKSEKDSLMKSAKYYFYN